MTEWKARRATATRWWMTSTPAACLSPRATIPRYPPAPPPSVSSSIHDLTLDATTLPSAPIDISTLDNLRSPARLPARLRPRAGTRPLQRTSMMRSPAVSRRSISGQSGYPLKSRGVSLPVKITMLSAPPSNGPPRFFQLVDGRGFREGLVCARNHPSTRFGFPALRGEEMSACALGESARRSLAGVGYERLRRPIVRQPGSGLRTTATSIVSRRSTTVMRPACSAASTWPGVST